MPGPTTSGMDINPSSAMGQSQLITPLTANILFKRLGHFALDNNAQSGYQTRELKTVHISVPCQYFKLVFHKNYENAHNPFNQVGLIRLTFIGNYLGDYEAHMLSGKEQMTNKRETAILQPRNLKL
jgi:hypothetical protein